LAGEHEFSVILEPHEGGGFTALVPVLPEVVTEGDSEAGALANRSPGLPIPVDAKPEVRLAP
jgi:antitoxin HicB